MNTQDVLLQTWRCDPLAASASLGAIAAFFVAARAGLRPRASYLAGAAIVVALAVASPVGALSDGYLFSAHMLQHLLLVLVVPPLALLGIGFDSATDGPRAGAAPRRFSPILGWILGVSAMWLWHAPTLCNAASQSALVHRAQEASLLAMGAAYWWPIVAPWGAQRLRPLQGAVYLFTACTACTVLGIIVTFSPVEVCSVYLHPVDSLGVLPLVRGAWGLTPAKDQQLGGLLMWVPACFVYGVGILALLARWYREDEDAGALARPEQTP
jgi:cytochrome c oxidase assembly factor CtaG